MKNRMHPYTITRNATHQIKEKLQLMQLKGKRTLQIKWKQVTANKCFGTPQTKTPHIEVNNFNRTLEMKANLNTWKKFHCKQKLRHAVNERNIIYACVDWDNFCRETCEVTMLQKSEKIGGPGKTVQINESKVGKRKYHCGHRVEGQWVFGGIEEDTRKCFLVPVEDRSEATLLPIIREWIEPGTLIVSDCWKSYSKQSENGYLHETVNHSKEFVNSNGFNTARSRWGKYQIFLEFRKEKSYQEAYEKIEY